MVAAELTPTSVQKINVPGHATYGTPTRFEDYLMVVTKVTEEDWLVTDDYLPGTFVEVLDAYTIDSSGDGVEEATTFTNTGTVLLLDSATVGTTYVTVRVSR